MNYNNSLNMRDLKKNVSNVRLDLILEAVATAELNVDPKDQASKGAVTKLYINTLNLNPEEKSLLVDCAPSSVSANGRLVCTFRLGKQFASENHERLAPLLTDKISKSVQSVYTQRMAMAAGKAPLTQAPVATQSEGLVSRLISKLTKPKHVEASYSLG